MSEPLDITKQQLQRGVFDGAKKREKVEMQVQYVGAFSRGFVRLFFKSEGSKGIGEG